MNFPVLTAKTFIFVSNLNIGIIELLYFQNMTHINHRSRAHILTYTVTYIHQGAK